MDTTEAEAYVESMLSFTNAKRALSGAASSAKALTRNQMVEAEAETPEPAALPSDAESVRDAMAAKLESEIARIASEPVEARPARKFRGFTLKGATAEEVRAERDGRIARIESDIAALMSFEDGWWFTDSAAYAGDGWGVPALSKRIRAHAEYIASKQTR